MRMETMRRCDVWLGAPLALITWMVSPLLRAGRSAARSPGRVRRIVVIKIFGMGSLLLAGEAFRALRRAYPLAALEIVTAAGHVPFLESLKIFHAVRPVSLASPGAFARSVAGILRLPPPDISINLEYFTWFTLVLQTWQRARLRAGFAEREWLRLRLLDLPVYFNYHRHMRAIFAAVAESLSAAVAPGDALTPRIDPRDSARVGERLAASGHGGSGPLVLFHVGASPLCRLRQWPLERFRDLIRLTLERTEARVILIGGTEEAGESRELVSSLPTSERLADWVGKSSIGETLALLAKADLLVTNDSGPLHWAVALGTPTVSFFGPETPDLYGPPPGPLHRVFYSRRYCSPCLTSRYAKTSACRDNLCLKDIGVEEVFAALAERLAKPRAAEAGG